MVTTLITHPDCLLHQPADGHPERPARLQTVLTALEAPEFSRLQHEEADLATIAGAQPAKPKASREVEPKGA